MSNFGFAGCWFDALVMMAISRQMLPVQFACVIRQITAGLTA
jgi:hypothetical protein